MTDLQRPDLNEAASSQFNKATDGPSDLATRGPESLSAGTESGSAGTDAGARTKNTAIALGAAILLLFLVLAIRYQGAEQDRVAPTAPAGDSPIATAEGIHPSFLYGRVTTYGGVTYEGRLRFGGDEEAFWDHYLNGVRDENPWVDYVPVEQLPTERRGIEIFGINISGEERPIDLERPFMVRFGDIARIEAHGEGLQAALERGFDYDPDVRVTLKSGTQFDMDRLEAGDFDDGVRVWDLARGVVDLGPRDIRSIEFLPAPGVGDAPDRLHGTVYTRQGDFTGFVQWQRQESLGRDELIGRTPDGEVRLRFNSLRSIEHRSGNSALVTLRDGRRLLLSDTRKNGQAHRGIYVDDPRFGRVLVSWDTFERLDFSPGGSGPEYGDFPPGQPLSGTVTTRTGRRLSGRLVYDLDESETTETLDAPSRGVDYTIPFRLISSIVLPQTGGSAKVDLHTGEELQLELAGDLGATNGGMLIFAGSKQRPEYVPWTEVAQIDFDGPANVYPITAGEEHPPDLNGE